MRSKKLDDCSAGNGDDDDDDAATFHQQQHLHNNQHSPPLANDKPWHSYDTVFLNAKAGMDGVDKEKVQKVVYEMSKGSKYFENEKRKEAAVEQKIERMKSQAALITAAELATLQKVVDKKVAELEASRDLSRVWIHVDLDAFYAAVETQENPSLRGKPMAVGGLSMICTANYEARKFGVRAAMPGFIARKLCPDLIFVKPDFDKYSKYSELTRQVFREYDEHFIARSMDEAYLDVTDVCKERSMPGEQIAEEIRCRVCEKTRLTCSAGVGPNRLLAKICSDINKPNGQYVIPNERSTIMNFISALPIRKVSGIGKVTERILREAFGVTTCQELLQKRSMISALFSTISSDFFLSIGLGIGGSEPPEDEPRKSLSNERTFTATSDKAFLSSKLEEIAEVLAEDMAKEGLEGRTLTLKLKTSSFEVRTRAVSIRQYIFSKSDILLHASRLLKAELPLSLRLIGLRMANFKGETPTCQSPSQRTLARYLYPNTSPGKPMCKNDMYEAETTANIPKESSLSSFYCDERHEQLAPFCNAPVGRRLNLIHETDGYKEVAKFTSFSPEPLVHDMLPQPLLEQDKPADEKVSAVPEWEGDGFSCLQCKSGLPIMIEEQCTRLDIDHKTKGEGEIDVGFPLQETIRVEDQAAGILVLQDIERDGPFLVKPDTPDLLQTSRLLTWIEDFRCSICGIEVPAEFSSVRQEHQDYHLAQLLQEWSAETSLSNQNNSLKKQKGKRFKEDLGHGRKQSKKDADFLPIDAYFGRNR